MIVLLTNADTELNQRRIAESDDLFVLCDTTNGDFSIDIPDATAAEMEIPFKVKGGGTVTLSPLDGQLIDDELELEITDTATIKSDLNDWWVI